MTTTSSPGNARSPRPVQRVVLVHGVWMVAASMRPLATRLRAAGFVPFLFGYRSLLRTPDNNAERLAALLHRIGPAHVVAHSLGGLITLETLCRHPDLPVPRVVCMGTPLGGSGAARALAGWPVLSLWTGRSSVLLRQGCGGWPRQTDVGMVAGSVPRGLGGLFARFEGTHDGTVALSETRAQGLADHVVMAASHSGLLLSAPAAAQVIAFLEQGRFVHDGIATVA